MLRTHDNADVGRSVARYRALGAAYARLADRLRIERDALASRLAPLDTVKVHGGATSRAILTGVPVARMMERTRKRLAWIARKLSVVNREVRFWRSAAVEIVELHREEVTKGHGWKPPVCHDPKVETHA